MSKEAFKKELLAKISAVNKKLQPDTLISVVNTIDRKTSDLCVFLQMSSESFDHRKDMVLSKVLLITNELYSELIGDGPNRGSSKDVDDIVLKTICNYCIKYAGTSEYDSEYKDKIKEAFKEGLELSFIRKSPHEEEQVVPSTSKPKPATAGRKRPRDEEPSTSFVKAETEAAQRPSASKPK